MRKVPGYRVWYPPALIDAAAEATREILQSGSLVLGKYTTEFEAGWASMMSKNHGISCASDSAALEMALRAVGLSPHKREYQGVLMPAVSFFGCVVSAQRAGGTPVFVECTVDNGVFPTTQQWKDALQRQISERAPMPRAAMLVYTAGVCGSDVAETVRFLHEQGIPTIEDCAHTHGTTLQPLDPGPAYPVGSFGAMACFSFFATKVLTTGGEGGMIVTDDAKDADYLRMFRNYGRGKTWGTGLAEVDGFNFRMTEWQAAVGCLLIKHFDEYIAKRREIVEWYRACWPKNLTELPMPKGVVSGYYRLIGLLPEGVEKLAFKATMAERGVSFQGDVYELTAPAQPIFAGQFDTCGPFPQSESFCARHVCLPIFNEITRDDVEYVCEQIGQVLT